ncbi:MAG: hypothetical protein IKS93_01625 [Methanobrevibacter sp.]|nr:hypothetical protein [Methanobrevibacter sp.]
MIVQLQLINYILDKHDFSFIIKENITKEYFPNFSAEFDFIQKHYKTYGQVPDKVTFLNSFPDFELLDVTESLTYLLNELYQEKNENYLVKTFNKVKDLLVSGKTDEALDVFTKSSENITVNKRLEAVNILTDDSRYDTYLDKCTNFNKYYLSTGFPEIDDALGGGIDRINSYFVISARPGVGKTLVLIKFAASAVKAGLKVGLYEGEMSVDKIAGRYDSMISHISNGAITHGNVEVANQYKSYLDELKNSDGEFYVLTRDMVGSNKVTVDTLEAFVEKYNLDILLVDQISLLDVYGRAKSYEAAETISKELKSLQTRKQIPLVVASQQNRKAVEEDKSIGVENLAMSDRIGADATEIISLTKNEDILKIDIIKARDGAKKYQFKYEIDFDKGRFNYIPDGEEPRREKEDEYVRDESGEIVF